MIKEEKARENPYIKEVQEALHLKSTDFSLKDKLAAERLLEVERLKIASVFNA